MDRRLRLTHDALAATMTWTSAGFVGVAFGFLLADLVQHGLPALSWAFLTTPPAEAGRSGGIGPILVSTGLILGVCLAASFPIALVAALFLAECPGDHPTFSRLIRRSLDVLAGVPSIVFGLFGNAFFCHVLGLGFSIVSGGLTLACMVLPLLIRTAEESFRSLPRDYRLSAAALGLSRTATIFHVLLPAAVPGLLVGFLLALGRAIAETAALIFTSGYVDRMPSSIWDSGRALSVHIYDLSMNVPGGNPAAYATALVLIVALLVLNGAATWASHQWAQRRIGRP